jgi:hypothetical protein
MMSQAMTFSSRVGSSDPADDEVVAGVGDGLVTTAAEECWCTGCEFGGGAELASVAVAKATVIAATTIR